MKKAILIILSLLSIVIFSACGKQETPQLSEKNLEPVSNESTICNSPYIINASNCCLDENNNGLCDSDETKKIIKEAQSAQQPSSIVAQIQTNKPIGTENESQLPKPKGIRESTGECVLSEKLKCIGYNVNSTNIQITILNSLGYNIRSVVAEAQNCGDSEVINLANGESFAFTIKCSYELTGSNYDGQLTVSYNNADTGVSYYVLGHLKVVLK